MKQMMSEVYNAGERVIVDVPLDNTGECSYVGNLYRTSQKQQ